MASETEIKNKMLAVDTDRLRYDSYDVISDLDRVQGYVHEMYEDVSGLNAMWKGKANETFTKQFSKDYTKIKDYINNLKALIETIKEKSKEYETCENNVKSYISKINI